MAHLTSSTGGLSTPQNDEQSHERQHLSTDATQPWTALGPQVSRLIMASGGYSTMGSGSSGSWGTGNSPRLGDAAAAATAAAEEARKLTLRWQQCADATSPQKVHSGVTPLDSSSARQGSPASTELEPSHNPAGATGGAPVDVLPEQLNALICRLEAGETHNRSELKSLRHVVEMMQASFEVLQANVDARITEKFESVLSMTSNMIEERGMSAETSSGPDAESRIFKENLARQMEDEYVHTAHMHDTLKDEVDNLRTGLHQLASTSVSAVQDTLQSIQLRFDGLQRIVEERLTEDIAVLHNTMEDIRQETTTQALGLNDVRRMLSIEQEERDSQQKALLGDIQTKLRVISAKLECAPLVEGAIEQINACVRDTANYSQLKDPAGPSASLRFGVAREVSPSRPRDLASSHHMIGVSRNISPSRTTRDPHLMSPGVPSRLPNVQSQRPSYVPQRAMPPSHGYHDPNQAGSSQRE